MFQVWTRLLRSYHSMREGTAQREGRSVQPPRLQRGPSLMAPYHTVCGAFHRITRRIRPAAMPRD